MNYTNRTIMMEYQLLNTTIQMAKKTLWTKMYQCAMDPYKGRIVSLLQILFLLYLSS